MQSTSSSRPAMCSRLLVVFSCVVTFVDAWPFGKGSSLQVCGGGGSGGRSSDSGSGVCGFGCGRSGAKRSARSSVKPQRLQPSSSSSLSVPPAKNDMMLGSSGPTTQEDPRSGWDGSYSFDSEYSAGSTGEVNSHDIILDFDSGDRNSGMKTGHYTQAATYDKMREFNRNDMDAGFLSDATTQSPSSNGGDDYDSHDESTICASPRAKLTPWEREKSNQLFREIQERKRAEMVDQAPLRIQTFWHKHKAARERMTEKWSQDAAGRKPFYDSGLVLPDTIRRARPAQQRKLFRDAWKINALQYEDMHAERVRRLGEGACGVAHVFEGVSYTATHVYNNQQNRPQDLPPVVFKLNKDLEDDTDFRVEMRKNDSLKQAIQARNYPQDVVNNFQFVTPHRFNGELMLSSRYMGEDMKVVARQIHRKPDFVKIVADWAYQLIRSMVVLEECQIVHRDIKPQNVMISFDESTGRSHVGVIDFGNSCWYTTRKFESPEFFELWAGDLARDGLQWKSSDKKSALLRHFRYNEQTNATVAWMHKADVWAAGLTLMIALAKSESAIDSVGCWNNMDWKSYDDYIHLVRNAKAQLPSWKKNHQKQKSMFFKVHGAGVPPQFKATFAALQNLINDMTIWNPQQRPSAKQLFRKHFLSAHAPLREHHSSCPERDHVWFHNLLH